MARPIAQTPILRGDDAKRFVEASNNPKQYTPRTFDYGEMSKTVKNMTCKGHGQK